MKLIMKLISAGVADKDRKWYGLYVLWLPCVDYNNILLYRSTCAHVCMYS